MKCFMWGRDKDGHVEVKAAEVAKGKVYFRRTVAKWPFRKSKEIVQKDFQKQKTKQRRNTMTVLNKLTDPIKKFILGKMLKKGIKSLAKYIVAFASAKGIAMACTVGGIQIDLGNVIIMAGALNSGYEMLRNTLKTTYPEKFGWL